MIGKKYFFLSNFNPFREFLLGFSVFIDGLRWLRQNPSCLLLLFFPIVLSFSIVAFALGIFFSNYFESFVATLIFFTPDTWWTTALFYLIKFILSVAVVILAFLVQVLLVNILSSPIYEYVSLQVEKSISDKQPEDFTFWQSLKLMKEEIKKSFFILFCSVIVLFIPGVNVLSPVLTCFFLAWEFYDFTLARRAWLFNQRLPQALKHFWSLLGLGIWMLLPLVQIVTMPLAVVGGTMLAI